MRLEEGVHGTHVAPVVAVALGGARDVVVLEVVDAGRPLVDEPGHDAAAHVVLGGLIGGVDRHGLQERVGVHDVVAHRGQDLIGGVRQTGGLLGLLHEGLDPAAVGRVGLDDAELVRQGPRLTDARDGAGQTGGDVVLQHLGEVHAVDVVRTGDDHIVRALVVEQVEGLVDRVGAPQEPVLAHALLGRHRRDVVAQHVGHAPRLGDVTVQRVGLVLGEHHDLEEAGVDHVGQGEVDEAVDAAEGHGGLGAIDGQGHEAFALATGEDDCENTRLSHVAHLTLLERLMGPNRSQFGSLPCRLPSQPGPLIYTCLRSGN